MVKRWREVKQNYHADVTANEEEAKRQLEINKKLQVEKETQVLLERRKRYESVEVTGDIYEQLLRDERYVRQTSTPHHNTKPLLLDAVIAPLTEEFPSKSIVADLLVKPGKSETMHCMLLNTGEILQRNYKQKNGR